MWFVGMVAVGWARPAYRHPEPPPLPEVAATLIGRALVSTEAYDELAYLSDEIGHRLSGSAALDRAIAWGQAEMREDGLMNVRAEPVEVPVWVRGDQRATQLTPIERELSVLALGGTVGTPPRGIQAPVVVVGSFEELAARAAEIPGKIVLFDVPFTTYGETVEYRGRGPAEAAKLGAVAALVRSVTSSSLDTPHTGGTWSDGELSTIPSAAVTIEAATSIRRTIERGTEVRLLLTLGAQRGPMVMSANTIGEVRGRSLPDEVVVLACHLDSWDVGQGAQDDGAGCVTVMEAAALIAALPVPPKRTIRVVLYTNEENGLAGGRAYAAAHAAEKHHAALEVDTGAGQPLGLRVSADADATEAAAAPVIEALRPVADLLVPIGASGLRAGHGGADIGELAGVTTFGLDQDTTGYWPIHHTEADTFEKVDRILLAKNVAATAVFAWALAEQ
ncbi:MAG: M20/M25/M40 family metallo-hydrolase [Myxococcota bacterium]